MTERAVTVLFVLRRVDCNDGVASYCETMIRGLRERGTRVVIVSGPVTQLYGSATRHAALLENVVEWVVMDEPLRGRPSASTVRTILSVIRRHDVDVISPQGFSVYPLAWMLSVLARRPVVTNYHPSVKGTSAKQIAVAHSRKELLKYRTVSTVFRAARSIAISKDIVRFFRNDCGIPERRIAYIPHGIDLSFFRPPTPAERESARRAFGIAPNALVCVLPGRLNLDKGHDVAIDAVRILRRTHPGVPVVCLFPGGGDQAAEIMTYAFHDDADREAFRFLGFLEAETFRRAYWAADVGLLPSRFEGFGYVIAEAMSCGCVPIRTPSGGCSDQIVEGVNGFVIPFNDAPLLATRLAELSDPLRWSGMRESALAFAARHFDQQTMIAETDRVYRRVGGRG